MPTGNDPKPGGDVHRCKLRLGQAHPVLVLDAAGEEQASGHLDDAGTARAFVEQYLSQDSQKLIVDRWQAEEMKKRLEVSER